MCPALSRTLYSSCYCYTDYLETVKSAAVSSVSPLSEQIEELLVVCGLYSMQWSYAIGGHMVTWKTRRNKSNEKDYVDSMGIKIANLKDDFLLIF